MATETHAPPEASAEQAPEAEPEQEAALPEEELKCTICGLRACWTK
jgi:hypothetical protein